MPAVPPATSSTARPVLIALGTRPEAIKLAGLVRALGPHARILHTGQHFDSSMWANVLQELPGVSVDHHVSVGGRIRGEQIGAATESITRYLVQNPCAAMVVQGDTNSTLSGALAANSLGIPVVHVEAGLRSHDRSMPEEINRVLVDQLADLCCAPLEQNAVQLRSEGIPQERILVTGNTLEDALALIQPSAPEVAAILHGAGLEPGLPYVLATVHRAGTVDNRDALTSIVHGLASIATQVPVVLPLHPRTRARLEEFGLTETLGEVMTLPPLGPRQFLALESYAHLILSDSGGVQEEACLLRRPLLVLRDSTERPELLDGWCRLLGDDDPAEAIARAWQDSDGWRSALETKEIPYVARGASALIAQEILQRWATPGKK